MKRKGCQTLEVKRSNHISTDVHRDWLDTGVGVAEMIEQFCHHPLLL